MADTSIYVALIAAGAGIIGAAVSQVSTLLRDTRKDKRDRQQRQADQARQACVDLLRASGELRTQIANNLTFQGNREVMGERLEEVRWRATEAQDHAANVSLLLPGRLAESADRLAGAVTSLTEAAVRNTNLDLGRMVGEPGFQDLDVRMATFRAEAKAHSLAITAKPGRALGLRARVRRRGVAAAELDR